MFSVLRSGSALSGLLLVLFVLVHLGGLVPALTSPATFEHYADSLHQIPWLPAVEIALTLTALIHVGLTVLKTVLNRQAGNGAMLRSRRDKPLAALASRSKLIGGLVSLGFVVTHLQQLRFPRAAAGHELEALETVLHHPLNLALYAIASLALGLHLLHGAEAAHRSLGWLTPQNKLWLRRSGQGLAALSSGGFLLVSLVLAVRA